MVARKEAQIAGTERPCLRCGLPFEVGQTGRNAYCSDRCQQWRIPNRPYKRWIRYVAIRKTRPANDNGARPCAACGTVAAAYEVRGLPVCSQICVGRVSATFRGMANPYKLNEQGAPSAGEPKLPNDAQASPPVKQVLDEAARTGRGVDEVAAGIAADNERKPLAWGPDRPTENGAKPFKLG